MVLLDGTTHILPEVRVTLSSPYFMGETLAKCMESPIYDVILGNITCELGDPDSTWKFPEVKVPRGLYQIQFSEPFDWQEEDVLAFAKGPKGTNMPMISLEKSGVTKEDLKKAQSEDASLQTCFQTIGQEFSWKGRK